MLKLDENYALGGDELNVTLYKREVTKRGKEPGQERWRPIRYYRNCENALLDVVDLKINATGLKDLKTVVAEIQELKATIKDLKGLGKWLTEPEKLEKKVMATS